jgi:hypothetical protein
MDKRPEPKKPPRPKTSYSAMEKCRAVLALWSERRKPGEICRELQIHANLLNQWQDRALRAILQALEPRITLEKGEALSPRLQTLLDRRMRFERKSPLRESHLDAKLGRLSQESASGKKESSG